MFRRECRAVAAACHDHIDLAANEIGGQGGQPIIAILRPAVFDRHVLILDITHIAQPLAESDHKRRRRARGGAMEESDYRHHFLLRANGEWPRSHRAAKKTDEFAPPHARPLDPMASKQYGSTEPSPIRGTKVGFRRNFTTDAGINKELQSTRKLSYPGINHFWEGRS